MVQVKSGILADIVDSAIRGNLHALEAWWAIKKAIKEGRELDFGEISIYTECVERMYLTWGYELDIGGQVVVDLVDDKVYSF